MSQFDPRIEAGQEPWRTGDLLPCASTSARGQAVCSLRRGHAGPHEQWVEPCDCPDHDNHEQMAWLYAEWEEADAD